MLRNGEIPYLKINPRGKYIIRESDLYRLITNAQTPNAKPFKDWLCEKDLPTIRSYSINPAASGIEYFRQAFNGKSKLQEMHSKNRIIAAQR